MIKRKRARKPVERLKENMDLLADFVENPERFGSFIILTKSKNPRYKIPTNVNLLDFKIKMEGEIIKTSRKIERILGFELPDGMKRT